MLFSYDVAALTNSITIDELSPRFNAMGAGQSAGNGMLT